MKVEPLTIQDVEYLAHKLAKEHLEFNERIPDFSTRFPNILESCLATPFQTFNRKNLYPTLYKKAAILFYLLIKNHPFQNGNKRIALTSLLIFLFTKNNKWIEAPTEKLYRMAVIIAQSDPEDKEGFLIVIENFIKKYSRDLTEKERR
jgi:death-on-curing family protein